LLTLGFDTYTDLLVAQARRPLAGYFSPQTRHELRRMAAVLAVVLDGVLALMQRRVVSPGLDRGHHPAVVSVLG